MPSELRSGRCGGFVRTRGPGELGHIEGSGQGGHLLLLIIIAAHDHRDRPGSSRIETEWLRSVVMGTHHDLQPDVVHPAFALV